jgi:hypothetical protein
MTRITVYVLYSLALVLNAIDSTVVSVVFRPRRVSLGTFCVGTALYFYWSRWRYQRRVIYGWQQRDCGSGSRFLFLGLVGFQSDLDLTQSGISHILVNNTSVIYRQCHEIFYEPVFSLIRSISVSENSLYWIKFFFAGMFESFGASPILTR